ncbi:uncharacterized protein LOC106474637 [Limulus polyphemus]|uniref:Uncharacterized protein LOC106474637 n=1 Tax=Limulus polyphemus TaxID=6850 RepID=A0ABM1BXX2_LIMPO|nr:uncharacterized protein LOC106474637 [Limulus polyphemus]
MDEQSTLHWKEEKSLFSQIVEFHENRLKKEGIDDETKRRLTSLHQAFRVYRSTSIESESSVDDPSLVLDIGATNTAEEILENLGITGQVNPDVPGRFSSSIQNRIQKLHSENLRQMDYRILKSLELSRDSVRTNLLSKRRNSTDDSQMPQIDVNSPGVSKPKLKRKFPFLRTATVLSLHGESQIQQNPGGKYDKLASKNYMETSRPGNIDPFHCQYQRLALLDPLQEGNESLSRQSSLRSISSGRTSPQQNFVPEVSSRKDSYLSTDSDYDEQDDVAANSGKNLSSRISAFDVDNETFNWLKYQISPRIFLSDNRLQQGLMKSTTSAVSSEELVESAKSAAKVETFRPYQKTCENTDLSSTRTSYKDGFNTDIDEHPNLPVIHITSEGLRNDDVDDLKNEMTNPNKLRRSSSLCSFLTTLGDELIMGDKSVYSTPEGNNLCISGFVKETKCNSLKHTKTHEDDSDHVLNITGIQGKENFQNVNYQVNKSSPSGGSAVSLRTYNAKNRDFIPAVSTTQIIHRSALHSNKTKNNSSSLSFSCPSIDQMHSFYDQKSDFASKFQRFHGSLDSDIEIILERGHRCDNTTTVDSDEDVILCILTSPGKPYTEMESTIGNDEEIQDDNPALSSPDSERLHGASHCNTCEDSSLNFTDYLNHLPRLTEGHCARADASQHHKQKEAYAADDSEASSKHNLGNSPPKEKAFIDKGKVNCLEICSNFSSFHQMSPVNQNGKINETRNSQRQSRQAFLTSLLSQNGMGNNEPEKNTKVDNGTQENNQITDTENNVETPNFQYVTTYSFDKEDVDNEPCGWPQGNEISDIHEDFDQSGKLIRKVDSRGREYVVNAFDNQELLLNEISVSESPILEKTSFEPEWHEKNLQDSWVISNCIEPEKKLYGNTASEKEDTDVSGGRFARNVLMSDPDDVNFSHVGTHGYSNNIIEQKQESCDLSKEALDKNRSLTPTKTRVLKTLVCQDFENKTKTRKDSMCILDSSSSERSNGEMNSSSLITVEQEVSGSSITDDGRRQESSCVEDNNVELEYEVSSVKRDEGGSGTRLNGYSVVEPNSMECCPMSNTTLIRDIAPITIAQEEDVNEYALVPNNDPPAGATVDYRTAISKIICDTSEKPLLWKEVIEEEDNLSKEYAEVRNDVCGSTEHEFDSNNRKWGPSFNTETEPKQKTENNLTNDNVNYTSQEHQIKNNAEILGQHNALPREANQKETTYKYEGEKSLARPSPMSSTDTDVLNIQEHSSVIRKSQRGLEFGQASQDLEALRKTIEMTKERRMNALRELKMLQEILGQKENISIPPSWSECSIRSDLSEEKSKNEIEGVCEVEKRNMVNLSNEKDSHFLLTGLSRGFNATCQLKETLDDTGGAFCDNENENQFVIKALEEHYSKTLEEGLSKEGAEELLREMEKLKLLLQEGDRKMEQLEKQVESTTEENIELRMNLLKVQEDLTKQNYHKDSVIEERDSQIVELEKEIKSLSYLRLKSEETQQEHSKKIEELEKIQAEKIAARIHEIRQEADCQLAELNIKVACQEEELIRLRRENSELCIRLKSSENICSVSSQDDVLETNRNLAWLESPLSSPSSGETSRLKKRVEEAESKAKQNQDRADYLNILLNQKLVELNKLQLTLSGQTKELIHLEKAYYQLRCHLRQPSRSRSLSRNSSKLEFQA